MKLDLVCACVMHCTCFALIVFKKERNKWEIDDSEMENKMIQIEILVPE